MIAILDAAYGDAAASVSCVLCAAWDAAAPIQECAQLHPPARAYEPGQFYKRELPLLLAVLSGRTPAPEIILIDGYVWLDDEMKRPGLGAHLFGALQGRSAVVGLAKTRFRDAGSAFAITRGRSASPLFVTAQGMKSDEAAAGVRGMSGAHRIPTLVRRADALARAALVRTE